MPKLTHDEIVLRTMRRHWFYLLGDFIRIGLALILPFLFWVGFEMLPYSFDVITSLVHGDIFWLNMSLASAWMLLFWTMAWQIFTDHALDHITITNKRVFEVRQHGFFNREVISIDLDKIQNINASQWGLIAVWLHFGNIHIETAGDSTEIHFMTIRDPQEVKLFINTQSDLCRQNNTISN